MEQGLREAALGGEFSLRDKESQRSLWVRAKERTKRLNHTKWERKEQVAPCSQGRSKGAPLGQVNLHI